MKKLVSLAAAVAAFGFVGAANAADMPRKAPAYMPPAPVPVVLYDWSGIYIGVEGGWQSSRIDLSNPDFGTISYSPRHSSGAIGGFAGIQRQFGQFVLGVEGGYLAAFGDTSLGAVPAISIFIPGGTGAAQAKLKDIWSIGGRLGWAIDRWMPYLTGGYANGRFQFNAQNAFGGVTEQANSSNSGAYFGGGVDWAVWDNWILGVEYRHYWFDAHTVTSSWTFVGGGGESVRFAPSTDTVLARLSYKFNWKW